ncbi:HAD family phosphatase [Altererythrobacter sp. SALINAS58]|uniref:HAD family hydrolase n=1 Tax=Alteripontixanthobacter muriae TaxID=2705546 RepID=UPI001576B81C|nr:HAD family phosphatase [Alteripontixanthobacter muriae]NTZ43124.1 HAD family phosphatase [Alteripontixanthobacter muriae]
MTDRIEAVVFDVGRVLVQWEMRALFVKLIDDAEALEFFLINVLPESWHFQHDAGRPIAEMVAERKAEFPEHAHLIEAYAQRFLETIPGPVAGTHELVQRLDETGISLFAITNFGADFWALFRPTAPVLDRFRDIVVSGQEKLVKPDPAIYRLAAERFGYSPRAMLFIDDNRDNVAAARLEGWRAHHFTDASALEAELTALGLLA